MRRIGKIVFIGILFFVTSACAEQYEAKSSDSEIGSELLRVMSIGDLQEREASLVNMLKSSDEYQRFVILTYLAKTEIRIEKFEKAKEYAKELLELSDEYKKDWNYGNAIHDGNMVLGMVALNNEDIDDAENYLLKAGNTSGSPQINNFGPSMILAEALLEKGRKDVVTDYLNLLKNVWKNNDGKLDSWIASIKGGGKPYFGANLKI